MTYHHLVALGGNLPSNGLKSENLLQSVVEEVRRRLGPEVAMSHWYRTPAFPAGSGPDFVNGALSHASTLNPVDFLAELHGIEQHFGRIRQDRWGPRTVDLDLIASGNVILPDRATWQHWHDLPHARQTAETPDTLILPHPRMQDRGFVLVPLMDIAPDWRHPVLGRTIAEMHADLTEDDLAGVERLADSGCQ
ncbi:2-amino-4-hydroxy-6-hydroxymethyldihydropteridine diphosphokinase [Pseudooceanicola onchidii]|uniref:2-amino-4-hydroxy-6- hydroxymethyldihydropteridine diphosphokinase n=1 Tax=Pseudooceanicola onchidii TaxID=2562279 RepID=UPI0030B8E6A3